MKIAFLAGAAALALAACAGGFPNYKDKAVRCAAYRDLINESAERGLTEVTLPVLGTYTLAHARDIVEAVCVDYPAAS